MPTLSPTDLKTLEQTRQRLAQLNNALASLQAALLNSDPLPAPARLQNLLTILSTSLEAYTTHLSSSPALSSLTAFPLPNYPGRNHEAELLLHSLLRKKLETGAEGWVEEGRARGEGVGEGEMRGLTSSAMGDGGRSGAGPGGGENEDVGEREGMGLWEWARMEANKVARGYKWGGLGEDEGESDEEGDEDEDEDEDMEGGEAGGEGGKEEEGGEEKGEALPVGDFLRFLSTGREPVRSA